MTETSPERNHPVLDNEKVNFGMSMLMLIGAIVAEMSGHGWATMLLVFVAGYAFSNFVMLSGGASA